MPWNRRGWTRYTSQAGLKNSFSTYRTSLIAPKPASNPDAGRVSPYSRLRCFGACVVRAGIAASGAPPIMLSSSRCSPGGGCSLLSRGTGCLVRGVGLLSSGQLTRGYGRILAGGGVGQRCGGGSGPCLELLHGMELQDAGLVVHDDGLLDGLGGDLGMDLFCQFVDRGDGGDKGRPVSRPLKSRGTVVCF
jgi:hypothetical protein